MMFFLYTGMSVMVPMYWIVLSRYFTEISCAWNITNVNYSDSAICELFRNAELKCTREGRYADYSYDNCVRYILCTQENDIFVQTSFACPNSYIFDPEKGMCVSSDLYECPCSKRNKTLLEISNTSVSPDQIITFFPSSEHPDASQLCQQNVPECVTFGKIPDYSTPGCTSYYTCVRTEEDYFSKLHFKCPHGYVFNAEHEVCTMSNNYSCPCDYAITSILEFTSTPSHQISNSTQFTINVEATTSEVTSPITDFNVEIDFKPLMNETYEPILATSNPNNIHQQTTNMFQSTTPQLENTDSAISNYSVNEDSTKFTGKENIFTTDSNFITTAYNSISTMEPTTNVPKANISGDTTETNITETVVQQTYPSQHPTTTLLDLPDDITFITSPDPDITIKNNDSFYVTILNVPIVEITTKLPNTSSAYTTTTELPNTISTDHSRETTIPIPVTEIYNLTDNFITLDNNIPPIDSTTHSIADLDFQTETSEIEPNSKCELRHCNGTGRLPDYTVPDCRGFILCLFTGLDFLEIKFLCPSLNIFNPILQICTLPTLFVCPCNSNNFSTTTQSDLHPTTEILKNDKNSSTVNDAHTTKTMASLNTESTTILAHTETLGLECVTPSCSRAGRIADHNISECGGYISCVPLGDESFLKLKYRCPNSSVFNPLTQLCTTPDLYTCPCSTYSGYTTTIAAISVNTETTTNIVINACTDDGFFVDISSTDCSSYMQCVTIDGALKKNILRCPTNSYFDPATQLCSSTYVCPKSPTYATAVTYPITQITTTESPISTHTSAQLLNFCPIISCTTQQRIPDNSVLDCKSYITCLPSAGGIFLELKLNCPGPNIFNPDLGICVLPDSYNCTCNLSSPTSELFSTTKSITTTNSYDLVTYSTPISGCNLRNSNCTVAGAIPDYSYPGCKKFRLCRAEADGYLDVSYECTENYVFDPSRSACTHEMYYTCPC